MSDDDYQPRTPQRLVEILHAQSENPRSWPREAASTIEGLQTALYELAWAVKRDAHDPAKGISGYTSARLTDAGVWLTGMPKREEQPHG